MVNTLKLPVGIDSFEKIVLRVIELEVLLKFYGNSSLQ